MHKSEVADKGRDWDIEVRGLCKAYGTVKALDGADVSANFGEVHALVGENGAGKSTCVRILMGVTTPDSGTVSLGGTPVEFHGVRGAMSRGIETVFQELSLMPDLSVAENVLFGRQSRRFGLSSRARAVREVRRALADLGLVGIDPRSRVGSLSLVQQQLVEIVKAVAREPRVLILDEATSSLPRQEVLWLSDVVKRLAAGGCAVFVISHRLAEAFEMADRFTVFRSGKTVLTGHMSDVTEPELVEAMLGRRLLQDYMRGPEPHSEEVVLETRGLTLHGHFSAVDLTLHRGEVLGIGGLQGQGQAELLLALYGWSHPTGEVRLRGERVRLASPRSSMSQGIAYVPEDRRTQGLVLSQSIRENLTLPALNQLTRGPGWIPPRREYEFAQRVADRFEVPSRSLEIEVACLSGGNQQKVLVGKYLTSKLDVLLLSDVTRGIDVGTKAELFELLRGLVESGLGVIWYSTDVSELANLCHRVAIMFDRSIALMLEAEHLTEAEIVQAAVTGRLSNVGPQPKVDLQ